MYLISAYLDAASLTESVLGFIYGTTHQDAFEQGLVYMKELDENPSDETAKAALLCFNQIDDDDKLFVQAVASYCRVFCYTALLEFDRARYQVAQLQSIEIGLLTLKKDTIRGLQAKAGELLGMIDKVEEAYKRWLREQEAKAISTSPSPFNWKALAIVLVVVVVVLAVLVIAL